MSNVSVSITTYVVSSNLDQGEVYIRGIYIPESGVKHHQANKQLCLCNNMYMKAR
jgi:hypothetical protein